MRNLTGAISMLRPALRDEQLKEPELLASLMRAALDDLGSLAGRIAPDDVLTRIFATFCVGK